MLTDCNVPQFSKPRSKTNRHQIKGRSLEETKTYSSHFGDSIQGYKYLVDTGARSKPCNLSYWRSKFEDG